MQCDKRATNDSQAPQKEKKEIIYPPRAEFGADEGFGDAGERQTENGLRVFSDLLLGQGQTQSILPPYAAKAKKAGERPPVLVKCGAVLLLACAASGATGVSAHGTLYGRWNAAPMTGGRAAGEAGHGPSAHWEKARIGLVTGSPYSAWGWFLGWFKVV